MAFRKNRLKTIVLCGLGVLMGFQAFGMELVGKLNRSVITTKDGKTYAVFQDEKGRDLCKTMSGVHINVHAEIVKTGGKEYAKVTDYVREENRAGHELWRRMRCNACAVQSAAVNVKAHGEMGGAEPISGRFYSFKDRIQAYNVEGNTMWVAMDNRVESIDLTEKKVTGTYGKLEGLPNPWVYDVLSNGKTVWIAHRTGIAALDIDKGTIRDLPEMRASYAALCREDDTVWVVADRGTWMMSPPDEVPKAMPALPTGKRIRKAVDGGIWLPHWRRLSRHFIRNVVAVSGNLYVESYGTIYALEDGAWRTVSNNGWELAGGNGRIWFVSPGRLVEYDVAKREGREHAFPEEVARGRAVRMLVDPSAVWVALVPLETEEPKSGTPGGLLRFSLPEATWRVWKKVGSSPADHISHMTRVGDTVWVAAMQGAYSHKTAHPGMTYVKRSPFRSSQISLHSLVDGTDEWNSLALSSGVVENRFICGQDGEGAMDDIVPERIEDLFVGDDRIFAYQHLFPKTYFSGYWSCVNQVAARAEGEPWKSAPVHKPAELNLQGEQPLVLNISNKGEMVLDAVGHDQILDLLDHEGTAWVVTQGRVAFFDPGKEQWAQVVKGAYRWYWRATAAYDDGKSLFIGSDRGLLGRLDHSTGLFAVTGAFKGRAVDAIASDGSGKVVAWARQETLGQKPVDLATAANSIDGDMATWDGTSWTVRVEDNAPKKPAASQWEVKDIRKVKKPKNVKGGRDRSPGNILVGPPRDGRGEAVPRFYLKDVFWPTYLAESTDGKSLWISVFSGLLRVDLAAKP